jgi:hypothetical protein
LHAEYQTVSASVLIDGLVKRRTLNKGSAVASCRSTSVLAAGRELWPATSPGSGTGFETGLGDDALP